MAEPQQTMTEFTYAPRKKPNSALKKFWKTGFDSLGIKKMAIRQMALSPTAIAAGLMRRIRRL